MRSVAKPAAGERRRAPARRQRARERELLPGRRSWRSSPALLDGAALLLLAAVLAYLALPQAGPQSIVVGRERAGVALEDFYGIERNESFSYRWSRPRALLTVPVPPAGEYDVTLSLQDIPAVRPPRTVTVAVNGTPVGAAALDTTLREYTFRYRRPARIFGGGWVGPLAIELRTAAFTPAGDPRALGVIFAGAGVEQVRPAATWRSRTLAAHLLLLVLAFAILRLLGRSLAARRDAPLVWLRRLLLVLYAVVAGGLLAAARFVPDLPRPQPILLLLAVPALLLLAALVGATFTARPGRARGPGALTAPGLARPLFLGVVLALWGGLPAAFGALGDADHLRIVAVLLLGGLLALRLAPAARPRLLVAAYALPTIAAPLWWQAISGPQLAGLPGLHSADRAAIATVPWVLALFGAGCGLLGALLPPRGRRALFLGDLAAGLLPLALPAVALFAARYPYSPVERELTVSWPGGLLVALIALKALNVAVALVRAAPAFPTERRVALALLTLFVAVYWSLIPWRAVAMGASGDEPGYLAAALSLAEDRDLELTNNGYAPRMVALTRFPIDAWGNEIADTAHDRLAVIGHREPATRRLLPVIAGPGLRGRLALVSLEPDPVAVTIRFQRADRPGEEAVERRTLAPSTPALVAPPPGEGWTGAVVEAARPVYAAVRLAADPDGADLQDAYAAPPATTRPCTPLALPGGGWETTLLIRNGAGGATTAAVTRRDGAGGSDFAREVAVPADGLAAVPLPAGGPDDLTATVCVDAGEPVATVLLARRPGAALLALPGLDAAAGTFPAPPAPFNGRTSGTVTAAVHNPGDAPAPVTVPGSGAPVVIPPRGTVALPLPVGGGDATQPLVGVGGPAPVVASYLLRYGDHTAAYAPRAAVEQTVLPAIVGARRNYVDTRVVVGNVQPQPVALTARLLDSDGTVRDLRRQTLCAGCVETLRLDFTDGRGALAGGEGAIVVNAERPIVVAASQLDLRTVGNHHQWGLAVLAAPGALVAGWPGALATVAALAALLLAQLYGLMRDAGIERRPALLATIVLGLSSPFVTFALQLYPEIPATALLIVALRLSLAARPPRGWRLAVVIACLVAVPLLHTRLLPLGALVAGSLFWRWGRFAALRRSLGVARIGLALLLPVAFFALWWLASRSLPPVFALSSRLTGAYLERYFSTAFLGHYLSGLLLDRATGLLPALPLLLLAGAGVLNLLRHAPRYGIWAAAVIGAQLLIVGLRADGWEAWGPPGRYLYPVAPLLGLAVASAWAGWSPRWLRVAGGPLAAWGLLAAFFFSWLPLAAYYYTVDRKWFGDPLARGWFGVNPLAVFPSILAGLPFDPRRVVPWLALFAAITLAGSGWAAVRRRARHPVMPGAGGRP